MCAPVVGRRIGDGGVHHLSAAEVDKEQHEDVAEAHLVGLREVARPRDVVANEGRPSLSAARRPPLHVLLDRALADADAELEQLTANALGPPARVARAHLADQGPGVRGSSPAWSRPPSPEEPKPQSMPTQHRLWLDQGHHRSHRRRCQRADDPPLRGRPPNPCASQATLRRHQLLPEDFILRDEGRTRTQHAKQEPPERTKHSDSLSAEAPRPGGRFSRPRPPNTTQMEKVASTGIRSCRACSASLAPGRCVLLCRRCPATSERLAPR